jgi:serine protease Do
MGVSFAIPSNLAEEIANQLIQSGEVTRGFMGIIIQQITPDLAKSFNVKPGLGIIISQVNEDSPAKKAGLRQGDVIIEFRGKPVKEVGRFRNQVALVPPGTREQLVILRNGKQKKLSITIGKLSEENKLAAVAPSQSTEEIGLSVQTLTPQLAKQFNARAGEGVIVTEVKPGSIASMGGIKTGMVILQVNQKPVKNVAEFKRAFKESSKEKHVLFLARIGNAQQYFALSW